MYYSFKMLTAVNEIIMLRRNFSLKHYITIIFFSFISAQRDKYHGHWYFDKSKVNLTSEQIHMSHNNEMPQIMIIPSTSLLGLSRASSITWLCLSFH